MPEAGPQVSLSRNGVEQHVSAGRSKSTAVIRAVVIALLAGVLVIYFFSPRFVAWRGMNIPETRSNPEVNRAVDTLAQLHKPLTPVLNPTNRPLTWRLLFPLLGYVLHLPAGLYLALPYLGCVLALALVAHLAYRESGQWRTAFILAALAATADWFFVSTGWLAYFDSWAIAGMLVAAFVDSRAALIAVCLLTPWVDERFLMMLPLLLLVRAAYVHEITPAPTPTPAPGTGGPGNLRRQRLFWIDAAIGAGAILLYGALRTALLRIGGGATGAYADELFRWSRIMRIPPSRFAEGIWMGARGAWLFIGVFLFFAWMRLPRALACLASLLVIMEMVLGLTVAGDMSRNEAMLMPVGVGGALLLVRHRRSLAAKVLPAVLLFNLLMPAQHVVETFTIPIFYLPYEIYHYRNPPPLLDPQHYLQEGRQRLKENRRSEALRSFELALQLDANQADAHAERALLAVQSGRFDLVPRDVDAVLGRQPVHPDALLARALLREHQGDTAGAAADLALALRMAPQDWAHRAEASDALARLRPPLDAIP